MEYHIFQKTVVGKNGKSTKRYYYWYKEGNIQRQKICKNCKTKAEALAFVSSLPAIKEKSTLIKDIANNMYIPGSPHLMRREQLGRSIVEETIKDGRIYINHIIKKWGDYSITDITVDQVGNYLFSLKKSGSWKARYISIFGEIFDEAVWYGVKVMRPNFPAFAPKTRKKDIFYPAELKQLFLKENFSNPYTDSETMFLFFTCCIFAGLRLSEARALTPRQFIFDKKALVIDGFCKKNGMRTNFNKKGSLLDTKARIVLLPENVIKQVQNYILKQNKTNDDFLFTCNNLPIRIDQAEKSFSMAILKSGIEQKGRKLSPHSLRYTYITQMRRTLSGELVRELVGHSNIAMTDYYTQFSVENGLAHIASTGDAVEKLFD